MNIITYGADLTPFDFVFGFYDIIFYSSIVIV